VCALLSGLLLLADHNVQVDPRLDPATDAPLARPAETAGPYTVTRVVDGDTLKVDVDGQEQTVRLIGVDTPETVHPNEPVGCFGPEASAYTTALVDQQPVWLEGDPTQGATDRYGRTLAFVWTSSDTMLNEQLVAGGYGREYTFNTAYRYTDQLRAAEANARAAGAGLWDACTVS
jgi:micrococcal nuclease